jgi:hypothetical protein
MCSALLLFSISPGRSQIVVTFDDFDLSHSYGYSTNIPNGYQGLNWTNFGVLNAILLSNALEIGAAGYGYGMVTPSNVAFDVFGNPAEIDARGTNFNFFSAYLTAAWNSNLCIDVQGFNGASAVYDTIVYPSPTNATLYTFDYFDIDRLVFTPYGGEPAFGPPARENFAMDDFMFEFIPEPSTFLLAAMGAVSLIAILRRRRT